MKKLSFIVPCYNESGNVQKFYDDVKKNFEKGKYLIEIIFINDGSKDDTISKLKLILKESIFETKIINFSRNFGKESAIYAGLKECTGDYAVIIDADLQQPPKLVVKMLDEIEKKDEYDIVAYYQENRIENKLVSLLKSMFYKIISKSSRIEFKNGSSDFRLFSRKVINTILELSEHNRFSKGIFAWIGYNTKYLPYIPDKRNSGKSSWSIKSLFKYGISGILSFSKLPLAVIFNVGIFNIIGSIIYLIILLIYKTGFESNHYVIDVIIFFEGITYIFMGILGEYIYRGYDESRNRPSYIIKNIFTNAEGKKK